MARGGFDIKIFGLRSLEKKFKKLSRADQGKILRPVVRASVKRMKSRLVTNLSGDPVAVQTGATLAAFRKAPVRAVRAGRGTIRIGVRLPDREDLGISRSDPFYYPMAIEYGHKRAVARPFIRPAVDDKAAQEIRLMGTQIALRITKRFRR